MNTSDQKIEAIAIVRGILIWIAGWNAIWFAFQAAWNGSTEFLVQMSFSNGILITAYILGYPIYIFVSRLFLVVAVFSSRFYDATVKHDDDFVRMISSRENRMLFSLAWPLSILIVAYWLSASSIVTIFRGIF